MLGEQLDGAITKIQSRDVVFLEGQFSRKGDIDDIDRFFEVDELHKDTPNPAHENESDLLPSGSVPLSWSVLLGTDFEATLLHRIQHRNIPRCRFEIEGGAFMYAPLVAYEPKNY